MAITLVDVYNRKQGRFQEGKFDTLPISGKNIYSTIDIELQKYGEDLMQNKTGAIVAIEPNSGEILSLISFPNYNPQELSGRNRSNNFKKFMFYFFVLLKKRESRRRGFFDSVEFGSPSISITSDVGLLDESVKS